MFCHWLVVDHDQVSVGSNIAKSPAGYRRISTPPFSLRRITYPTLYPPTLSLYFKPVHFLVVYFLAFSPIV